MNTFSYDTFAMLWRSSPEKAAEYRDSFRKKNEGEDVQEQPIEEVLNLITEESGFSSKKID